jgi:hypothetical protein
MDSRHREYRLAQTRHYFRDPYYLAMANRRGRTGRQLLQIQESRLVYLRRMRVAWRKLLRNDLANPHMAVNVWLYKVKLATGRDPRDYRVDPVSLPFPIANGATFRDRSDSL